MKNYLKILFIFAFLVVVPFLSFAQTAPTNVVTARCIDPAGDNTIGSIICQIGYYVNVIIPILIAVAVVVFIIGIIQYVLGKSDDAKTEGRSRMIYGLIGLMVIVSIWGLIAILQRTFGIDVEDASISVPCIEVGGVGGTGVSCPQNPP